MPRWLKFLTALLLGLSAGLIYGWLISPVEFVDTTPDFLSQDYRTDFVLMNAEVFASTMDAEPAVRALALLSSQSPFDTATQAVDYARTAGYSAADIALIQKLATTLQAWPGGGAP
jgi:hypothetical protein